MRTIHAMMLHLSVLLAAAALPQPSTAATTRGGAQVVTAPGAAPLERLAAREVRRYVYLRTGQLLPMAESSGTAVPSGVVVCTKDRPLARALAKDPALRAALEALGPQQYLLKSLRVGGRDLALLAGGDPVGTLYAAYRFAEHLGARFYLHGDVLPDERVPLRLTGLAERGVPLFSLRGIQPFHDFPEGPDWWNTDDYKAYLSQLPKLRMNFLGLHTYPEGGPNAEPTVWIGQPGEFGPDGQVKQSYPASYQNTLRGNWGYAPRKTGEYFCGASALFERDDFGAEVMAGCLPSPRTPEECNAVFNRTGAMLREAFTHARALGIKTCVGTETPLVIPRQVRDRLQAAGKDPASQQTRQALYEGIFRRIAATYPADYFWLWTPEGWTWGNASEAQVSATVADMNAAMAGLKAAGSPCQLATCGWVLGPQNDRALFDQMLPNDVPMSCINRQVGNTPVDQAFERVSRRPKWAIPWLEDDPGLTAPQLWVGRMRRDAADALQYGCTGLMGIHWRTRVLGPNIAALAQAAWDQSAWNKKEIRTSGPVGGNVAAFPTNPIAGTEDPELYRTVRYDMSAYRLALPNGAYTVTLKFCEPHYSDAGKRVFGVKLQGKPVIQGLDLIAKVGKNKALDYTFEGVAVTHGRLDIDFVHEVEFPCIAAIAVQGPRSLKINCGGPAYKEYLADPPAAGSDFPTADFYRDWATQQFGAAAGPRAAAIFEKVDCKLPRPADWVGGPGGLRPDARPWEQAAKEYAFVAELDALGALVKGAGARERFDYWANTFRYMRAMARVRCAWAVVNRAMEGLKAERDAAAKAHLARERVLPLRRELARALRETYGSLLATVTTPGEMGTVMNWEQHILPDLLLKPGKELEQALGAPLPTDALLPTAYSGPARLIVPTVRGSVAPGEALRLKVLLLASGAPRDAALFWRALGKGAYARLPLQHVARGVYSVQFPPADSNDLEYYVRVTTDRGETLSFPATAPAVGQTVVVQ